MSYQINGKGYILSYKFAVHLLNSLFSKSELIQQFLEWWIFRTGKELHFVSYDIMTQQESNHLENQCTILKVFLLGQPTIDIERMTLGDRRKTGKRLGNGQIRQLSWKKQGMCDKHPPHCKGEEREMYFQTSKILLI